MLQEIYNAYQNNSIHATKKNIPNDILIHFLKRVTKELILHKHFETRLRIENTDINVLK